MAVGVLLGWAVVAAMHSQGVTVLSVPVVLLLSWPCSQRSRASWPPRDRPTAPPGSTSCGRSAALGVGGRPEHGRPHGEKEKEHGLVQQQRSRRRERRDLGLGILGAWFWFWQQADGFWAHLYAIFEGIFWPAYMVFQAFQGLYR